MVQSSPFHKRVSQACRKSQGEVSEVSTCLNQDVHIPNLQTSAPPEFENRLDLALEGAFYRLSRAPVPWKVDKGTHLMFTRSLLPVSHARLIELQHWICCIAGACTSLPDFFILHGPWRGVLHCLGASQLWLRIAAGTKSAETCSSNVGFTAFHT